MLNNFYKKHFVIQLQKLELVLGLGEPHMEGHTDGQTDMEVEIVIKIQNSMHTVKVFIASWLH